jgi:serine protease Do
VYVIDLDSKDFDAYLRLEDAAGKDLGEDDDSGPGTNARLFFIPPESGDYIVVATSARPKTGKYRVTVQEAQLEFKALPLNKGAVTEKDRLAVNGPRSPYARLGSCKLYRVELKAGMPYVFDLVSSDFDAYLVLADATLKRIASDDDSGGKRNARISFTCKEDGTYYLAATGHGNPEGTFELKIGVKGE